MSKKVTLSSLKSVQLKHDSAEEEDEEEQRPRTMPTIGESGAGVPAFLAKLWRLVDDPDTNNLICWSEDGRSFIINNQAQFARELLPLNYKHNNMASFIRQLNMYGFHKITSIENGGLRFDRDEIEFSHPCFKRNYPYLLDHIKRKISNTKTVDEKSALKQETVTKVLSDVKAMRGRQDNLDSRFSVMKQENEALWREIASLRQKHAKQQQIVNKLIQFLISIVQPSRNMSGVKRHMQLMINDTPENARTRTTSETESENGGPVIHELSEELLDEVMNPQSLYGKLTPTANYDNESVSPLAVERPRSNISSYNYDYSNQSAEDILSMQAASGNIVPGALSPSVSSVIGSPAQQVTYTVTEAPDSHSIHETPNSPHNEEVNVLTTPMVRQEEARNRQLLKEKNKQRRREADQQTSGISTKSVRTEPKPIFVPQPLQVKSEPDVGVYTPSNLRAASIEINQSSSGPNMPSLVESGSTNLYDVNFISNDMPAELFEDASLLSDSGCGEAQTQRQTTQQQQFGRSTVSSGNFDNLQLNVDGSLAPESTSTLSADANVASTSKGTGAGKGNDDEQNMAMTKYTGNDHEQLHEEVNGHLDIVQDELDTLKDLLRGDGVSIDQSMLMGLFGDTDLLENYGLSFPNDNLGNEKKNKGSELIAYQPSMYDLSDILDSDDNNDKPQNETNISGRQVPPQNSILNTPRHDI